MQTADIVLLCTILGAFVGVSQWLSSKSSSSHDEGEWRGKVDAKLDLICGIQKDVIRNSQATQTLKEHVARLDEHCTNIDKRLDKLEEENE